MKIFRKIFRMPRINWASYLLMVGVAMIVVAAAVMVKAIFFSGSNAAAPVPATRTYVLKLEGGGNILVPVPSDKVGQFTAAVNEAIANSSLALRPFLMDSLAARIMSVDSSAMGAQPAVATRLAQPLTPSVHWWEKWWVWMLAIAVVIVVLAIYAIARRREEPHPTTTNYFWTKLKFAWPWVILATGFLTGAMYLSRPEMQDHRFFPLLVLGVFCAWPSWRAFARIPVKNDDGTNFVPTVGEFVQARIVSSPALVSAILILFYLMLLVSGNLN